MPLVGDTTTGPVTVVTVEPGVIPPVMVDMVTTGSDVPVALEVALSAAPLVVDITTVPEVNVVPEEVPPTLAVDPAGPDEIVTTGSDVPVVPGVVSPALVDIVSPALLCAPADVAPGPEPPDVTSAVPVSFPALMFPIT